MIAVITGVDAAMIDALGDDVRRRYRTPSTTQSTVLRIVIWIARHRRPRHAAVMVSWQARVHTLPIHTGSIRVRIDCRADRTQGVVAAVAYIVIGVADDFRTGRSTRVVTLHTGIGASVVHTRDLGEGC